jgi:K+ transporter
VATGQLDARDRLERARDRLPVVERLAAAYGMSVTIDMVITSVFLCVVASQRWGWKRGAIALGIAFLPIDLAFLGSNLLKLPHGGWFSLVVARSCSCS